MLKEGWKEQRNILFLNPQKSGTSKTKTEVMAINLVFAFQCLIWSDSICLGEAKALKSCELSRMHLSQTSQSLKAHEVQRGKVLDSPNLHETKAAKASSWTRVENLQPSSTLMWSEQNRNSDRAKTKKQNNENHITSTCLFPGLFLPSPACDISR